MPLETAVNTVFGPLGMHDTMFNPPKEKYAFAATEIRPGQSLPVCGTVHDERAEQLGGVAGHAGLFADLEDIIRYASMLAGDGRNEEGVVFSYRSIHLATTERTRGLNEARGYGFRITKRSDPFLGHLWPSDGYGLTDPASGSLIAVSPDDGFFVALLLNSHGTSDDRREIVRMHKLLLNAAYAAFQHDED